MKHLALLALPTVLGLVPGHFATASDRLILGKRLVVADPAGTEDQRSILVLGRETATDVPGISDPRTGGATLTVVANGGTSTIESFVLDGAGWSIVGTVGYKYAGPTGAGGDPVKKVIARVTPGGVALLKVWLRGDVGTQTLDVVPPNGGTDGGIILDVAGGDRYCVAFGGTAGGTTRADTARLWKVTNAATETGCPTPPSTTSTSSSSSTTSSTSSTTSSTTPPVCGNNVREGSEQCDGTDPGGCFPGSSCRAPGAGGCQCCWDAYCPIYYGCCHVTDTCLPGMNFSGTCLALECRPDHSCSPGYECFTTEYGDLCFGELGMLCAYPLPPPGVLLPCVPPAVCSSTFAGFCCLPAGESCTSSYDCCSGTCTAGTCS